MEDIVLETLCQKDITLADAIRSCAAFAKHVDVQAIDSHMSVTGYYALDMEHDWMEISLRAKLQLSINQMCFSAIMLYGIFIY